MRQSRLCVLLILAMVSPVILFAEGLVAQVLGADCGSGVGPCRCGDRVITDTRLSGADPALRTPCPCDGLVVASGVALVVSATIRSLSGVCEDPSVSIPAGIRIESGANGVTVSTGRIVGFEIGVLAEGADGSRLANLQILDSTFTGVFLTGDDNLIASNIVARTANRSGIDVAGDRNVVRLNQIRDSDVFGLTVAGADNLVSRNIVQRSGLTGIEISGDHATVERNRSEFNGGSGFGISGTNHTVSRNRALENGGDGFTVLGTDSAFDRNHAIDNGGFGIRDTTGGGGTGGTANTYVDNLCDGNALGDSSPPGLCS